MTWKHEGHVGFHRYKGKTGARNLQGKVTGKTRTEDKPWYTRKEVRELQQEWYAKLKEEGFEDVEGGVEGHLMRGKNPSMNIEYLTYIDGRKTTRYRGFDDVADSQAKELRYAVGDKSYYYQRVNELCVEEVGRIPDAMLYSWCLHAQGVSTRDIEELADIPRSQVRKYVAMLRQRVYSVSKEN